MGKFLITHNQGGRILQFLDHLGSFNSTSSVLDYAFFLGIHGKQEKRDSMKRATLNLGQRLD